jgi:hypothetical protein
MAEDRNITFGKYKGEPIKKLILNHLGYVMWCLSNLNWFKLTDDEQKLYDAMAIAVINSDAETSYPKEELKNHIRDTWAMINKDTPFSVTSDGYVYCPPYKVRELGLNKYVKVKGSRPLSMADLAGLAHSASKMGFGASISDYNYEEYDEYIEDALRNDFFH